MNILIYICILILVTIYIHLMKKLLNNQGLLISLFTLNILSFILSFKLIKISNFSIIPNSITYISIYTIIYLLLEKCKKKEVKKIIYINLISNLIIGILLYIMSYYTQSIMDTTGINMTNVFIKNYRLLISYPIITYISQYLTIPTYLKIKEIYDNKFISTSTTYICIGLVDIILYTLISYYNVYDTKLLIEIILSTYMIRLILTVIHSIYLIIVTSKKKVIR